MGQVGLGRLEDLKRVRDSAVRSKKGIEWVSCTLYYYFCIVDKSVITIACYYPPSVRRFL